MSTAVNGERRTVDDIPWQDLGSCHGMDSDIFFHPDGERGRARTDRVRRAKQICRSCHVIDRCRAYALRTQQPFGIWGGMSEQERQKFLESRARFASKISSRSRRLLNNARRGESAHHVPTA
ncbi:WhiB family transcriptional regulator [Nocardia sp. NPDC059091]|uniref:WhiB family transcriptional regulator n=1 Tax=unclassified Nocardia TaxID=2637762 RepID=UPI0036CC447D